MLMFLSCLNFKYQAGFSCFVNCHGKFASQVFISQDDVNFQSIVIFCYSQKKNGVTKPCTISKDLDNM